MKTPMTRRRFLHVAGATAAGTAILTVPQFLVEHDAMAAATGPVGPNPFYAYFGIDDVMLKRLLKELLVRGADNADVYFQHARVNNITFEDGIVSKASTSVDLGVGLRTVVGEQTGYAFTEDLDMKAMVAAASTAAVIAKGTKLAPPKAFTIGGRPSFYRIPVDWADVGVNRKLPIIQKVADMASKADAAIQKVTVQWADEEQHVLVATKDGQVLTDIRPMTRLWCTVVARRGDVVQSNSSNIAGRRGIDWYTDDRLAMLVRQAVDRTMVLFDARRPPAGEMPVVLASGPSGILLHEAIGHGMEADFNRKNISIYSGLMGKPIAPDFVTIYDDGTCPNERGALNFDDEGTVGQKTVLVDKGVLRSYMHDNISAAHYKVPSTGNGRRQSFRFAPIPRMRCTYMASGPSTPEEIIASVQKGIIAETFTNGEVQIGAGDFTFYIKNGWLIEGGRITAPIKDCNIIGNGPEALRRVTMAANDAKLDTGGWTCGKDGQAAPVSQGLPTLLVSRLTVGGENA
jgi:TldD protein